MNSCKKEPVETVEKTKPKQTLQQEPSSNVLYNEHSTEKLKHLLQNTKLESSRKILKKSIERNLKFESNRQNESRLNQDKKASSRINIDFNENYEEGISIAEFMAYNENYSSIVMVPGESGNQTINWDIISNRLGLWRVKGYATVGKFGNKITIINFNNFGSYEEGCFYAISGISGISSAIEGITGLKGAYVDWQQTTESSGNNESYGWIEISGNLITGSKDTFAIRERISSRAILYVAYIKPRLIGKDIFGNPIYENPCNN
ncbi:hypothetical protein ACFRAE_04870 [Sphingobacterium sp. HJSM2_6]|uniref:hypothetical protein n=1 Tax=Sphingobacterium sp. HJSM2_6 TaxID=3366264 RepID=UPI003BBE3B11